MLSSDQSCIRGGVSPLKLSRSPRNGGGRNCRVNRLSQDLRSPVSLPSVPDAARCRIGTPAGCAGLFVLPGSFQKSSLQERSISRQAHGAGRNPVPPGVCPRQRFRILYRAEASHVRFPAEAVERSLHGSPAAAKRRNRMRFRRNPLIPPSGIRIQHWC